MAESAAKQKSHEDSDDGKATPIDDLAALASPAMLYEGKVMHLRTTPFRHHFVYRVFSLLVDLDAMEALAKTSPLLSHNRFNLFSFHDKDHAIKEGEDLRSYVDRLCAKADLPRPARVFLLSYPRMLGYVFNPISIYYGYDANGQLSTMIYEVRNTFGDRHSYVEAVTEGQRDGQLIQQTCGKLMYVSPFFDMDKSYHFRLQPPGETLKFRILETEPTGPCFHATFNANGRPLTTAALVKAAMKIPFLTFKVFAGIHWEALKIWIKGGRYHSHHSPGSIHSRNGQDIPMD